MTSELPVMNVPTYINNFQGDSVTVIEKVLK